MRAEAPISSRSPPCRSGHCSRSSDPDDPGHDENRDDEHELVEFDHGSKLVLRAAAIAEAMTSGRWSAVG